MKRVLFITLTVIIVAGLIALYEILWAPNSFQNDRFVIVSKGENFAQVMTALENAGVIRSRFLFDAAGRILEYTTRMQIGKYRFKDGMSNKEILEDLRYGKTVEVIMVTIPEGMKATRQARVFTRNLGIDSSRFMMLVHDAGFAKKLNVPSASFEGFLMPGTYKFFWQTDEEQIITDMVNEFWKTFNDTLRMAAQQQGQTIHDVVTLASIVEMETPIDSERAIIAGVYTNRLEKGMRLQADPTIQYVLKDGPRRLYKNDLGLDSPYNTYLHSGLPPGPINNPGKASLMAALFPKKNKFLFFVATGQGGHTFTRTYPEHLKAIRRFQRVRAEREAIKQEG
jgi:UPF0755 protein